MVSKINWNGKKCILRTKLLKSLCLSHTYRLCSRFLAVNYYGLLLSSFEYVSCTHAFNLTLRIHIRGNYLLGFIYLQYCMHINSSALFFLFFLLIHWATIVVSFVGFFLLYFFEVEFEFLHNNCSCKASLNIARSTMISNERLNAFYSYLPLPKNLFSKLSSQI